MKIVDDKRKLQIGKTYYVQCAQMKIETGETVFVPILGEKHTDVKFGIYFFHYHIDGRFLDNIFGRYVVDEQGRTNTIINVSDETPDKFQGIIVKRKKCLRLTTGIKPPPRGVKNYRGINTNERYYKWYESMVGQSCKGKVCPHRGTIMQVVGDKLICPLHNLRGSIEQEVIIE